MDVAVGVGFAVGVAVGGMGVAVAVAVAVGLGCGVGVGVGVGAGLIACVAVAVGRGVRVALETPTAVDVMVARVVGVAVAVSAEVDVFEPLQAANSASVARSMPMHEGTNCRWIWARLFTVAPSSAIAPQSPKQAIWRNVRSPVTGAQRHRTAAVGPPYAIPLTIPLTVRGVALESPYQHGVPGPLCACPRGNSRQYLGTHRATT